MAAPVCPEGSDRPSATTSTCSCPCAADPSQGCCAPACMPPFCGGVYRNARQHAAFSSCNQHRLRKAHDEPKNEGIFVRRCLLLREQLIVNA